MVSKITLRIIEVILVKMVIMEKQAVKDSLFLGKKVPENGRFRIFTPFSPKSPIFTSK